MPSCNLSNRRVTTTCPTCACVRRWSVRRHRHNRSVFLVNHYGTNDFGRKIVTYIVRIALRVTCLIRPQKPRAGNRRLNAYGQWLFAIIRLNGLALRFHDRRRPGHVVLYSYPAGVHTERFPSDRILTHMTAERRP